MNATTPLLILGTREISEEIADIARDANHKVAGFVENLDRQRAGSSLDGVPVYWVEELPELAATHLAVCGISTTHRSRFTSEVEAMGLSFATVVHPTAHVSHTAVLGRGCIVGAGCVVGSHTVLGEHVFVNRGALIGHHTRIEPYSSLMPGANVAGSCRIGPATWIGMGANVIDKISVGAGCVVGAGAVVTKDVPDRVLVVGVPARIAKTDVEGR